MNKIIFFLATQKGLVSLKHMIKNSMRDNIGAVITFFENDTSENFGVKIIEECKKSEIPCYIWSEVKNSIENLVLQNNITGAVAISWRYLLPLNLNNFLKYPLIVFHDSLLPKYRGFAPTPTAIMAGENEIGVTAFFAANEVDTGEIILQSKMKVTDDMYMKKIIDEQSEIYAAMLEKIILDMNLDKLSSVAQNEENATYSIWRNLEDCQIDWTKSSTDIYNFVRALGEPYPNAFTYYDGIKINILKTEIIADKNFVLRDYGKIWSIKDNQPEIICGSGMIKIISAVNLNGEKVLFKKLRCRLGTV